MSNPFRAMKSFHIPAWAKRIRGRMAEVGVSQMKLAVELGISVASLNLYLNGNRTPPADFERRVAAALDRLEQAEHAADKARQRVLGKGAVA